MPVRLNARQTVASLPPQQLRRTILFVSLVISAFLIAHSINAFVADALSIIPTRPAEFNSANSALPASYASSQSAEDIRSSGLFVLPPPTQTAPGGSATAGRATGAPVRASLGLTSKIRLLGVVMGDRNGIFAIIEELSSKKQGLYRLYEEIADLGELTEIRRNGIVVRQGNLEELLELEMADHPPGSTPPTGNTSVASPALVPGAPIRKVVDRREVESAMNDLPKLLTQARAVPNMVNGAIDGFRIEHVDPTSFYEKIGVQRGDVLQRVNGVDIRDPSTMLSLLQQLKNERTVKLDLVRNSQRSTITYELR
jgi:general secretion pathway protein C